MLKLIRPKTIDLSVSVTPPGDVPVNVAIQMRYLDVQERLDYLAKVAEENMTDLIIIDDLVCGWAGICDHTGASVAFSSKAAKKAFRLDYLFFPVRDAIINELQMGHISQKN